MTYVLTYTERSVKNIRDLRPDIRKRSGRRFSVSKMTHCDTPRSSPRLFSEHTASGLEIIEWYLISKEMRSSFCGWVTEKRFIGGEDSGRSEVESSGLIRETASPSFAIPISSVIARSGSDVAISA
jgi:hypothetical protein